MPSKYDQQIREKAVRLVRDHAEDYPTEWAAIKAMSGRLGLNAETLRKWLRRHSALSGPGWSSPARVCCPGSDSPGRLPWVRLGKLTTAGQHYDANTPTVAQIAELVGVSHATVHRHLGPARRPSGRFLPAPRGPPPRPAS